MDSIVFGCGCVVSRRVGTQLVGLVPCEEHGGFHTVRKAMAMLQSAIEDAHDQLPPGPVQEERRAG